MEDVDVGARTTTIGTTARKESTHVRDLDDDDPLAAALGAAARSALAGEDRKYWSAHPEIPALVSYFLANALEQRPKDTQAFATETFGQHDLKDRVHAAIARNGGCFSSDDQQQKAVASSKKRDKKHKK